ncbi:DUF5683 domain-containing protein [Saccharicrinis sp. FJH54]|uniref:DUF5683 domain-containing protein n=1 Tax=Saccharicrinis sp. FJH54 TaxID=3344665 RepID=UPI0035D4947F
MKHAILFFFVLLCFGTIATAQQNIVQNDSLPDIVGGQKVEKQHKLSKVYVPKKAAMLSAAFPGLGQIYNHKWWKVPILYAGFAACAYGINYNNERYSLYRYAYIDLVDSDPSSRSYIDAPLPMPREEREAYILSNKSYFEGVFKSRRESFRRDRDLMIIVTVGVYVLNIIDANVDAHLADFDVSNDLSMNVSPVLLNGLSGSGKYTPGLSLTLNF